MQGPSTTTKLDDDITFEFRRWTNFSDSTTDDGHLLAVEELYDVTRLEVVGADSFGFVGHSFSNGMVFISSCNAVTGESATFMTTSLLTLQAAANRLQEHGL